MAKKSVYLVNGTTEVTTVKEVSDLIGRRVSKADIMDSQIAEVEYIEYDEDNLEGVEEVEENKDVIQEVLEAVEEMVETLEEAVETLEEAVETLEEEVDEEEVAEEPDMKELLERLRENNAKIAKANPESAEKKSKKAKVELVTDDEGNVVYPEVGFFEDEKVLKKYYKQLSDEQLDEWLEVEGLEATPNDHPGINRMRKCMVIKELHFPKEVKPKSKSPYAKWTTEELIQMALDANIEVADAKGDLRILRMYAIMALKKEGILE